MLQVFAAHHHISAAQLQEVLRTMRYEQVCECTCVSVLCGCILCECVLRTMCYDQVCEFTCVSVLCGCVLCECVLRTMHYKQVCGCVRCGCV